MYTLIYTQKIPLGIEEAWEFFSSPANLKILTPEHLGFDITSPSQDKMYPGQIISYIVKPIWNIPLEWVSEITHIDTHHYFIDEQRSGPYKFWHHEHHFTPIANGVEMKDIVHYAMPFGPLGKLIHHLKVKHDLEAIFSYRREKLEHLFGSYNQT